MNRCVAMLFVLVFSARAMALDPNRAITQYAHQVWKTEQGLPQKQVNDIVQTQDGHLWLTSHEALVRFNGINFTVFDSRDVPELRARNLPMMAADPQGNLWIATEGAGLVRYKDGVFKSFTTRNGLSDNSVLSVIVDLNGDLWIGTQWGGLNHFRNGKMTIYKAEDGTPGNRINFLYVDERGDLWIGGEGLSRFHNGTFTRYAKEDGLPHSVVTSITGDRKGSIWLGTWGGGVSKFENGKFFSFSTKDGLSHNEVRDIHYDKDGNLWVGTREGGLCRFKNGKWETYSQAQGLSDNGVRALYEDRDGSLWIGTYNQGLNRLKDGTLISYSKEEGLPNDDIWSIYGDRFGTLWMGTQNGIIKYSNGTFTSFGAESGLSATNVVSVHGDSLGQLWVGTRGGGVFVFKDGRFTPVSLMEGSSYRFINCLFVDRSDNAWVGTADGIIRIRNGSLKHYTTKDGLAHNSTSGFLEDRSGNLWIASRGGLTCLRNNQFKSYKTNSGVTALYEDIEGTLWVGMIGGLSRFENGKFRTYTMRDGLHDDNPAAIADDDSGHLWISGSSGIFRIQKRNLLDYDRGAVGSITCITYGVADGMKDIECSSGDPSVWKMRDGRLWFPTLKGVTMVNPRNTTGKAATIPVTIEKFFADQQRQDTTKNPLEIPPRQKRLEFHYSGLNLFAPERIRFQYRLDGYDSEWQNARTQRYASYTNIPPGNYTFKVRAGSDEGIWNQAAAHLAFYVQPHFYQTIWFYMLCTAAVIGTAMGLHRQMMRKASSEFVAVLSERARIAREIHDGLTQALAGIVMQLETVRLLPSGNEAEKHLDRALELARKSVEDARQTIGVLRPKPFSALDFPEAMRSMVRQQAQELNMKLEFEINGNPVPLRAEAQPEILRICQESVQNALKHANASSIRVELHYERSRFRVIIRDDGKGLDEASSSPDHFGLQGMQERSAMIKAQLFIESVPTQGTRVELIVPV